MIIEPPIRGREIIIVAIKNLRTGCSTFLPLTVTSICIVERCLLDLAFLFLIVLVLLAVLMPTVFSLRSSWYYYNILTCYNELHEQEFISASSISGTFRSNLRSLISETLAFSLAKAHLSPHSGQ